MKKIPRGFNSNKYAHITHEVCKLFNNKLTEGGGTYFTFVFVIFLKASVEIFIFELLKFNKTNLKLLLNSTNVIIAS